MQKLVVLAVGACLLSSGAAAQDVTDWTGFYAGIMASGATGESINSADVGFPTKGALLSGIAGYRFALDGLVIGIEGQASVGTVGLTFIEKRPASTLENKFDVFPGVSVTGSVGIPVNDMLPYAFAGVGVARGALTTTYGPGTSPIPNPIYPPDQEHTVTHLNLVAGIGLDAKVTDHILLRAQYTYTNMLRTTYFGPVTFASPIHSLGAGLIYKF